MTDNRIRLNAMAEATVIKADIQVALDELQHALRQADTERIVILTEVISALHETIINRLLTVLHGEGVTEVKLGT